ncbi:hypothetical protein COLO4_33190 [Corchorus olitorius]|uniref:Uncharacterized protein n=1 Tax=Corchorus olitorius TaxID=93759 RepID=A0A1R3GVW9_9ROSI|nr:hypothetical protein COLO4_33190 [Corchorus olitorius]
MGFETCQGIETVLVSPDGDYYPAIARLRFSETSNATEDEAWVLGNPIGMRKKASNRRFSDPEQAFKGLSKLPSV